VPLQEAPATEIRRARLADVEPMALMINAYAARGLMLPRTPAELYRLHRECVVVTDARGQVVACGGLRIYGPHLAEIVSLAVREDLHGRGIGAGVVDRLLEDARRLGIDGVFAMTLEEGFFHRKGFARVPRNQLPEKMSGDCRTCARREGCRELAVYRRLSTTPRGVLEGRRLRVVRT
jgi:amino-acid N-acetyltransferase